MTIWTFLLGINSYMREECQITNIFFRLAKFNSILPSHPPMCSSPCTNTWYLVKYTLTKILTLQVFVKLRNLGCLPQITINFSEIIYLRSRSNFFEIICHYAIAKNFFSSFILHIFQQPKKYCRPPYASRVRLEWEKWISEMIKRHYFMKSSTNMNTFTE